MNYAAVDIIRNENNELFVLEINSTPMFYNFISFYGEDAFGELLKNLIAVKLEQKNNQKQQERKLEEVIEIPPKN
jgi:glutathione synthase/RimK-type ligase-like ATP-grasp enzyme